MSPALARLARIALTLLLVGLAACGGDRHAALPPGSVVVVLGDSISAGHGLAPEQAWPVLLAEQSGWRVINAGVSGDTTADGLARLPDQLEAHRPAAVILELGGNDLLRRMPDATARDNLKRMVALVRAAGAEPILMATPRPSLAGAVFARLSDAEFYAAVAKAEKVFLIDGVLSDVLSEAGLKLDQLHPNAEGQRRVAAGVAARLKQGGWLR